MQPSKEYKSYSMHSPMHDFLIDEAEEQIESYQCYVNRELLEIDIKVRDKAYELFGLKQEK